MMKWKKEFKQRLFTVVMLISVVFYMKCSIGHANYFEPATAGANITTGVRNTFVGDFAGLDAFLATDTASHIRQNTHPFHCFTSFLPEGRERNRTEQHWGVGVTIRFFLQPQ